MTTPTKQRRREILFISLVALVMITLVGTSAWQRHNDSQNDKHAKARETAQAQRFQTCIIDQVNEIHDYLDSRSTLTAAEFAAIDKVIFRVSSAAQPPPKPDVGKRVAQALVDYRTDRETNITTRANTKLPKFPTGECVQP